VDFVVNTSQTRPTLDRVLTVDDEPSIGADALNKCVDGVLAIASMTRGAHVT
jgi:hypothetical protein